MQPQISQRPPDEIELVQADLVQMLELLLASGGKDGIPQARRMIRKYRDSRPELAAQLVELVRSSPVRAVNYERPDVPLDSDSRMPLVRIDGPVGGFREPILPRELHQIVQQLVDERRAIGKLSEAGLAATRTALFVGPPGVGKTMAARWVAHLLDLPLVTLDLATVMSSYLGRTGANVRRVLDYARSLDCVLLLDEIDAVAKRRDDNSELGELKRLVTVLLQEVDNWPEGSLLIAATNHEDLLDPAVWRRFEVVARFGLPDQLAVERAIEEFLDEPIEPSTRMALAAAFAEFSYSDIEQTVMRARRTAVLNDKTALEALLQSAQARLRQLPSSARIRIAVDLLGRAGASQRAVSQFTGVSRDTLRKHAPERSGRGSHPK